MPGDVRLSWPYQSTKAQMPVEASDGELLRQFVEHWDHAAFCDLVGRHGPMVLGVCRDILRSGRCGGRVSGDLFTVGP